MAEIIPAIIANNLEEVKQKIAAVEGVAQWVQLDVMDGVFTPPTTFNDPARLRELETHIKLEAHLMIARPEEHIDAWLDSPVERILVHYEATTPEMLHEVIRKGEEKRKDVGIALKYETPISVLDEFFAQHPAFRSVQLMSIAEIGYYGHSFEEGTLEKIASLRAKHPNGIIEIDGGANEKTIPLIVRAGADRIAAGGIIFNVDDPKKAYETLAAMAKK